MVRAYWWGIALTWRGVEGYLQDVADPGVYAYALMCIIEGLCGFDL